MLCWYDGHIDTKWCEFYDYYILMGLPSLIGPSCCVWLCVNILIVLLFPCVVLNTNFFIFFSAIHYYEGDLRVNDNLISIIPKYFEARDGHNMRLGVCISEVTVQWYATGGSSWPHKGPSHLPLWLLNMSCYVHLPEGLSFQARSD